MQIKELNNYFHRVLLIFLTFFTKSDSLTIYAPVNTFFCDDC